jgi:DNA-binding transcriptional regulator YiaG
VTKVEFTQILKDINLSKKEFAQLANISYNTINNWSDKNKPVPPWVKSWLENYIEAKKFDKIKEVFNREGIK